MESIDLIQANVELTARVVELENELLKLTKAQPVATPFKWDGERLSAVAPDGKSVLWLQPMLRADGTYGFGVGAEATGKGA